jgi:3-phosphoshikimate 1-carboxyvinyltransferase
MNIKLQKSKIKNQKPLIISGSKSESNRLLILQALFPNLELENLSNSDDTQLMQKALQSKENCIDVHHAGTAMRFLTAYFATQVNREVTITGSARMKERPIKILVDALQDLGANITYLEKEGFPPLKIKGQKFTKNKVVLKANVSSQYISALLLIAPKLKNGLELTLEGEITSVPYINMTLSLLNQVGIKTSFEDNKIHVDQQSTINNQQSLIESDWSSVSYFYSIVALSKIGTKITLSTYKKDSLQGDSVLATIYMSFGVETIFENESITLQKSKTVNRQSLIELNLKDSPDIAQTIAVTCFGLGIPCCLIGLHTLKIKETDRLEALKIEIEKLGGKVIVTNDSLQLKASKVINENIEIKTYNDHRMAMAFAPLALKTNIIIQDSDVVSKSYPDFWEDFKTLGFSNF